MFTDKGFFKNLGKKAVEPKLSASDHGKAYEPAAFLPAANDNRDATDGLTIEDYAKKSNISTREAWRRLRCGELIGRTERGQLMVYEITELPPLSAASEPFLKRTELSAASLPPLSLDPSDHPAEGMEPFLSLSGGPSQSPEMALLLDHLSLAKEENREILRMTQESIRKVTALTDAIVSAKDELLSVKKSEIETLKQTLAAKDEELRRLRQSNEDLEMLAKSISTQPEY